MAHILRGLVPSAELGTVKLNLCFATEWMEGAGRWATGVGRCYDVCFKRSGGDIRNVIISILWYDISHLQRSE